MRTAAVAASTAGKARTAQRRRPVRPEDKAGAAGLLPSAAPKPRSRSAAAPATGGRRRRRAAPRPRSACPRRPGPTARAPRPACPSAPAVALAPAHARSITRRPAARDTLVPWRHPLARQASNDCPPAAPAATPLPPRPAQWRRAGPARARRAGPRRHGRCFFVAARCPPPPHLAGRGGPANLVNAGATLATAASF